MKLKNLEKAVFFLVLLFLPTQLGRHFWPDFSFVYSLPVDYLSPTVYFWDIVVVVLLITYLLQKKPINKIALNLFLFFILTQLVSLLLTANIGAGLVRLEQYLISGIFGLYVASLNLNTSKLSICLPLMLTIILESFLAVVQFIKGATLGFWIFGERTFILSTPGIAKFDFYGRDFLRPYATFPHPNVLAAFLLVVSLILYYFLYPKMRVFLFSTFFVSSVVILLTVSRTTIFILFIWLLILLKNKARLSLITGLFVLLPVLYTRYSSILTFDNLALLRREEFFQISFNQWIHHLIFGVGLNNFIPKAADLLLVGPNRFLQPAHNIFLLILAETGLVGFMGWVVLIGYPIYKNFQFSIFNFQFKIIWISIFILGMFDHYFLTLPQGYRLLFLIWGLSMAALKKFR